MAQLDGESILAHARDKLVKQAHHQIRYGPDMTRNVKQWHRLQADWSMNKQAQESMLADGSKKVSGWPGFVREAFSRLYSGDKIQAKLGDTDQEHMFANRLHKLLDDLPEWKRMTERCRGDSYAASAATLGMGQKLYDTIPKHQHDAEDARRRYNMMLDDFNMEKEHASENGLEPPPVPNELKQAQAELEAARQEAENCAANMDDSAVRQAARSAINQVQEHLEQVDQVLSACGWGTQDAGPGEESAAEVKKAIAERLHQAHRLREIMDLAGRMKNIMKECQAAKVRHGVNEITDIQTGAEIARLLPNEAALMRHPKGKLILFRKLLERGALQYKLEGKEKVGRGPLIICVDDSGSMNGTREVWAKALTLAMLELARKQGRSFGYCLYSNRLVDTLVEQKNGKKTLPAKLIDSITRHSGGGTAFDPPLRWALDTIEKEGSLKDADVVFISDGECQSKNVSEHKARFKKLGARCWGIALGAEAVHSKASGSMPDFCDKVYPITELREDKPSDEENSAVRGVLGL